MSSTAPDAGRRRPRGPLEAPPAALLAGPGRRPPRSDRRPAEPADQSHGRIRPTARTTLPFAAVLALTLATALGGCLQLAPLAEVQAAQPADRVLLVDGQRVHLERAGHSGSAVVLLHGFGESTYQWRHLLPALARHHRVVALDLNGFGFTERPSDLTSYTYPGQARLVLATLDRLGLDRAHLIGHSWGGGLAVWLAGHHPERVTSLVLIANTLPVYDRARRTQLARFRPLTRLALALFLRPGYVARGLRTAYLDDRLVTPELVDSFLERLAVEGAVDAYRGLAGPLPRPLATDADLQAPELAAIAQPTLVVWGREDRLIDVAEGERHAAEMPNATFHVLEQCGHVPMEERPAELLALVEPFLATQDRAAVAAASLAAGAH